MYFAGDVVLFRGDSIVSRLIRWGSRSWGEPPSVVNHVGIMIGFKEIVEASDRTKRHKFLRPPKNCWVYRNKRLSPADRQLLREKALKYVGTKYGRLKIVAHTLDRLLFFNRYVARRLCFMDSYPICSWLVANCYDVLGIDFGVDAGEATPDDIWDYIVNNSEWFEVK